MLGLGLQHGRAPRAYGHDATDEAQMVGLARRVPSIPGRSSKGCDQVREQTALGTGGNEQGSSAGALHTTPVKSRGHCPNSSMEKSIKIYYEWFFVKFEYFMVKKFHLLTRVWISIFEGSKLLSRG